MTLYHRVPLVITAAVWIISGILWYFYPALMNKWLNNASDKQGIADMTRGFGVSLILGGVVEMLLLNESTKVVEKATWARLIFVLVLLLGFVVYNRSDFVRRLGFWGTLMSTILPVVTLVTLKTAT